MMMMMVAVIAGKTNIYSRFTLHKCTFYTYVAELGQVGR